MKDYYEDSRSYILAFRLTRKVLPGASSISVDTIPVCIEGKKILIGADGPNPETRTVLSVYGTVINLTAPLEFLHLSNSYCVRTSIP
jgi:hypothetical protein